MYEKEGGSAKRINAKVKEIWMHLERLLNEEIEIDTITTVLPATSEKILGVTFETNIVTA